MPPSPLFASIAKQRVTPEQPSRNDSDLDVDRCAALHNTLMLYGWVCSGKKISDMQKRSWWSKHGSESLQKLVRPSLKRYLSKVFDVPGHNFFYHVTGIARPMEMLLLGQLLEDPDHDASKVEKHRFLVIYTASKELVKAPAGIV
nr:hypothetical protein CFP56_70795 [Quercus suber]